MSRRKLINQLKNKNSNLNLIEVKNIVEIFTGIIEKALEEKNNIEIRNFGRWYFKKIKENFNARNPATNELIYKPERIKIRFKASKKLNKIINE